MNIFQRLLNGYITALKKSPTRKPELGMFQERDVELQLTIKTL